METRLEHIIRDPNHSQNKGLDKIITKILNTINEIKKINTSGEGKGVKAEALLFRLTNLGELFHDLQFFIQTNHIKVSPGYSNFIQQAVNLRNAFVHHYNQNYDPEKVVAACVSFNPLADQSQEELKKILTDQTLHNFNALAGLFQMVNQQFPSTQQQPTVQLLNTLQFLIQKLNQLINHQDIHVITADLSSTLATAIQNCVATIIVLTYSQQHSPILTYLQPLIQDFLPKLNLLSMERGKVIHEQLNFNQEQLKAAITLIRNLEPIVNASQLCVQNGWMSNYYNCDQITQLTLHNLGRSNIQQKRENETLTQTNQTLQGQITTLTQANQELNKTNQTLQGQVTTLTQVNQPLNESIQTLQEQVTTLTKTNQTLNTTLVQQKNELNQNAETIKNLSKNLESESKNLEASKKELEKSGKQLESNKSQIENQKKTIENLQKTLTLKNEKNKAIKIKLESKEKEIILLNQEVKKNKEEKKKFEKIEEKNNSQTTEIEVLNQKIEEKKTNIKNLEKENEAVKKELEKEKERSKKIEKSNTETINQQTEEIKQLKQANATTNRRLITGASAISGAVVGGLVGNLLVPGVGGVIGGAVTGMVIAAPAAYGYTSQQSRKTTKTTHDISAKSSSSSEDAPIFPSSQPQLNFQNQQLLSLQQTNDTGGEKVFPSPLNSNTSALSYSAEQKKTKEDETEQEKKFTSDSKFSNQ